MKFLSIKQAVTVVLIIFILNLSVGCGQNSSPEGRMNYKLDELQDEMKSQMNQQHKALLDSLSAIRQELQELKATQK
ncbi:MAG: hypothetical protein V4725_16405 [Bacteroidota bacterium]